MTEFITRRQLLRSCGGGMGSVALSALLADQGLLSNSAIAEGNPFSTKQQHFPVKAKSVIWLFMNGGPSQVDTWDYKPELEKHDGQELEGFDKNTGFFTGNVGPIMKSPFKFRQYGESGSWVSEIFPQMARHVDKMAFIHSGYTESNNHSPALFMINTGMKRMGFPSLGSWVTYGLGTENQNLPAFVTMSDPLNRGLPKGYAQNWGAGFLPSIYQGTWFKPQGDPIDNLKISGDKNITQQRALLDTLKDLNQDHQKTRPEQRDLETRINSFELAYRMQQAAPEALDIQRETSETLKAYGVGDKKCEHFAKQCLVARRMVERGVRFIQIYSGGTENARSWDGHTSISKNHGQFAGETDQPIGALLQDLDQRGLLDSTLVIWGGEFGRLSIVQKGGTGRDHNPHAMTYWMAGGGVKAGVHYGATDEIGNVAVENRVSVNDLHATILQLCGLDHLKLTYRLNGRDFRLTDVAGKVIKEIIA
ncbi:MAG: DUF1501 domain-containing protein [Planctomycetaceae bacterium]|nr:DUF1501 domain-containing protein [Planctomycetaceae bacterium]MBT5886143.1 DUF1501 domain-containing protein [Planctomycetaceae bacterium]MBT7255310.1 DUF1501 domain-containing protein [Planctomycetaceae bacterium]